MLVDRKVRTLEVITQQRAPVRARVVELCSVAVSVLSVSARILGGESAQCCFVGHDRQSRLR